ncbi:MAG: hypothetical protein JRN45_10140 [Nitrososphaerota archaeon]|nr:hypothetical protein [Nitrososphaerota archaeon]
MMLVTAMVPTIALTFFATRSVLKVTEDGAPRHIAFILSGRGAVGIVIALVALRRG